MPSVIVQLSTRELSSTLSAMREWLDMRRYEPSDFRYNADRSGAQAAVNVSFKVDCEAVEFAVAFGGDVVVSQPSIAHRDRSRQDH